MNLDDTISKINSIDPIALEERLRIKPYQDKAIKKFDEICEKIAKNEPKVWLTVEEAKLISIFFGDVVYSRGINLTERERSLWSMLAKRIVQAESRCSQD